MQTSTVKTSNEVVGGVSSNDENLSCSPTGLCVKVVANKRCKDKNNKNKKSKHKNYITKGQHINIPDVITKPEQAKKTIEMARLMEHDMDNNPYVLSIYISQPKKNQLNKAGENIIKFILKKRGIGMSILHGDLDNSSDPDGFVYRALNKDNRIIIALANKTRLPIVQKITSRWLEHKKPHTIRFYCDEAQKTFPLFMKYIYEQLEPDMQRKVRVILIDAHLEGIVTSSLYRKHFGDRINKLKNEYDLSEYLFMSSMPYRNMEWRNNDDILASYSDGTLEINKDDYILWPLRYTKDDQYAEAFDMVDAIPDVAVLNINGDNYHVFYKPDTLPLHIKLTKKNCKNNKCFMETCSTCFPELGNSELEIVKKIKNKYAKNKTFILSGHSCIDRAMTYHTPDMPFTKTFIGSDTVMIKSFFDRSGQTWDDCSVIKKEDISQMVKRMCASYKTAFQERGIPLPIFYGPEDIYNGVCQLENVSKIVSGLEGIIDQSVLNQIKERCKPGSNMDETEIQTKKLEDLEQPDEYYYKVLKVNAMTPVEIQHILSEYRSKLGGERVSLKTITSRLTPNEKKNVSGKYIEDVSRTPLTLDDFKTNHDILKSALNDETSSRIRICYDEQSNPYFVIVMKQSKNQFSFNNKTFNLKSIQADGNCLFNCFVQAKITHKSILRLRCDAASDIEDHLEVYEEFMETYPPEQIGEFIDKIRTNAEWNNEISDILPYVLADMLEVNIHIYDFKTDLESGGEEILFNHPLVIPEDAKYTKNIYLKHSNGTHYDLFEKV